VTEVPAEPIRTAATAFLRGDTSVVEFTYAFRAAMNEVIAHRTLDGVEVDLFSLLERWVGAGWADRPAVVDELRTSIRGFTVGS
jgi:hypothetical protein